MKITIKRAQRRPCSDLPNESNLEAAEPTQYSGGGRGSSSFLSSVSNLHDEGTKTKNGITRAVRLLLLAAALPAFMVAGCGKEGFDGDTGVTTGNGDIRFEIGFTPTARVATGADFESSWETGDAIGIFAYDADNVLVFNNEKLTYNGSEWVSSNDLYWRGKTLKFYAYYPYDASVSDPTAIVFVVKSDQSGTTGDDKKSNYNLSDLMTATDVRGISAGKTVSLMFKHEFAMIQVEVPALGKGWGPGDAMTVSLTGVKTGATLNLTGGGTPAVQTGAGTGNVKMYLAGKPGDNGYSNYTYRAAIPVQTLKDGSNLFLISNEGVLYKSGGPDTELELKANNAEIFTRSLPNAIKSLHKVFIPKGTFTMGSPDDEGGRKNDETQHKVTLTRDFYMSKYEITNAQYAAFLNANSIGQDGKWNGWSDDANKGQVLIKEYSSYGLVWDGGNNEWKPAAGKGDLPVVYVTWYGAKAYADWIGGSLPTEAQWEYACRAGTTTVYSFGNNESDLGTYAWYNLNSGEATHEVGTKAANPWGLYDMYGNVWEWCSDWYGYYYYNNSPDTDPTGPDTGSLCVLRGGSWSSSAPYCRSACRNGTLPGNCNRDLGFRVVFVP
ncbi:SUMF1/EgtB/PvdO family nonheme iron enzyme [uncultured Sanguibacteroides sp.]|uniref:SUMF1/EgtB/PvdO family nonheme iron enzyme n=1 Tax=uncultured Sanguibacteroides sp. TaxID=1635151 RepID=UPI0025E4E3B0|nr:SUMF1/EgtB/PvdO family nonheme iron enzyme [uncultured Sanguibacteroides sp.]